MAGRREVFQQALRRGHSFAWDRQWSQAVAAYQMALAEFPDDAAALTGLGMALVELKRLPEALPVYQRLARLNPLDVVPLEKVADIQERLGQPAEAARTLVAIADAYLHRQNDQGQAAAVAAWERAARLAPDLLGPHQHLAKVYEREGKTRQAIQEYLAAARLLSQRHETDEAIAACQSALQLDPHDAEVLRTLDLLRHGAVAPSSGQLTADGKQPAPGLSQVLDAELPTAHSLLPTAIGDNPVQEAWVKALAELTERARQAAASPTAEEPSSLRELLQNGQRPRAKDEGRSSSALRPASPGPYLSQGLAAQQAGDRTGAMKAFEQALAAGMDGAAFHFNLGLLYQQQLRFEEAMRELRLAADDPNYALGSHFAIGECYRALGRIEEAVRHFIEALKIVDVSAAGEDQAESFMELYASLADTYTARGEREQAVNFTNALVSFLSGPGWQIRAVEARQRLNQAAASAGMTVSLGEMLGLRTAGERVLEAMADCRANMERGLIMTAIEDCYRAIDIAPFYLPAHERLAALLAQEGRLEEAATKYGIIAQAYRERGDTAHAIAACLSQLQLSPLELGTQETLIALLLQRGELDRALEQMIALADAYYQLAQGDRARDTYREALKLATRRGNRDLAVQILHRLGDIESQRLDWHSATMVYKQIRRLAPEDERAMQTLVELYLKLGQDQRALTELDALLHLLMGQGKTAKARAILEELVHNYPEAIVLREKLAELTTKLQAAAKGNKNQ